MFENIMERLRSSYSVSISENPAIANWKQQQKQVFGYMCHNFPEEIIAAAGVLPIKFLGKPINVIEANQYQSTFMCHYGRSVLELGLNGDYDQINGLVYAYGCEGGCNLFQVLMEIVPKNYQNFLHIPHNSNATGALEFYLAELESFCRSLREKLTCSLNDEDLRKAISLYNQQRKLLKEIYELRGSGNNPLLTGLEVGEILEYVVSTPKEEANELLRQLMATARQRSPKIFSGPRLLVQGTILPDLEFYQIVEELGGMVIGDDLCQGSRYFWDLVDETAAPLEALAKHRLDRLPCSCMSSEKVAERRLEHLLYQVEHYNADGVVLAVQKWCDSTQMDRPFFIEQLKDKGIPVLPVEVERTVGGSQFRTRIEAFMEMIELSAGSKKKSQLGGSGR
jgi:benzoyl-CoA reductase subunit C